jgi:hypothetical protein
MELSSILKILAQLKSREAASMLNSITKKSKIKLMADNPGTRHIVVTFFILFQVKTHADSNRSLHHSLL